MNKKLIYGLIAILILISGSLICSISAEEITEDPDGIYTFEYNGLCYDWNKSYSGWGYYSRAAVPVFSEYLAEMPGEANPYNCSDHNSISQTSETDSGRPADAFTSL